MRIVKPITCVHQAETVLSGNSSNLYHKGTWFEKQAVVDNSGLNFCGILAFVKVNAVQSHVIIKLTYRPTLDIVHHFALLRETRFGI